MSDSVENYLKVIYKLQEDSEKVSTSALADRMGVAPPSVTSMITRLASLGLLQHDRYRGVHLTDAGARAALEVIRHHRLWELFLAEALQVPLERVHGEAERLEHNLSDDLEEALDRALGHPTVDPHGDPIPSKDLTLGPTSRQTLAEWPLRETVRIARVPDSDPSLLHYLSDLGLLPGAVVRVSRKDPFGGPLYVDIQSQAKGSEASGPCILGRELASRIFVEAVVEE